MIFKLTIHYDQWENGSTPKFEIVDKAEFKEQTTNYNNGSRTVVKYREVESMTQVTNIVTPSMFEYNYTEYATFLITTEATLKAEKEK